MRYQNECAPAQAVLLVSMQLLQLKLPCINLVNYITSHELQKCYISFEWRAKGSDQDAECHMSCEGPQTVLSHSEAIVFEDLDSVGRFYLNQHACIWESYICG